GVVIGYQRYCQIKQAAAAGRNASQIAAELGLHRQTVAAWLGRQRYERSRGAQRPRRSKLDAYRAAVARLIDAYPLSAMQVWHKLKEQGYDGGYSIVKEYIRRIRPKTTEAFLTLKFAPGQCAQVDWAALVQSKSMAPGERSAS